MKTATTNCCAILLAVAAALTSGCGGDNTSTATGQTSTDSRSNAASVLASSRAVVQNGALLGNAPDSDGIVSFKGIPYAAPPVGALRWKAPQPAASWSGTRDATNFGHQCWQGAVFGPVDNSKANEDCLYLNVWTGAKSTVERRPVMVWIHGGGFQYGTSGEARYDGKNLAKKGVVVVSLNYRLGVFGFLARPDLDAESEGKSSGMYGMLDQVAALHWVKANAPAFGGDPDNVTIFGESAGAHSIGILAASPQAKNLFHKAILQSGAFWETPKGIMASHATASKVGMALAANAQGPATLTSLRAAPASQLITDPTEAAYNPSVDGYVLPADPYSRFAAGLQNDVPLLAGVNANEGEIFSPLFGMPADSKEKFVAGAAAAFGSDRLDAFLQVYPATTDIQAKQSQVTLTGDGVISAQVWEMQNLQKKTGKSPVYSYYFSLISPYTPLPLHTMEIPYVFQNLNPNGRGAPNASDIGVADAMSSYWTNFAKTGNPNGGNLPSWPAYNGAGGQVMGFGTAVQAQAEPGAARFQFLSGFRRVGSLGYSY